jgi:methyl-accepting chemotaxis protein
MNTDKNLDHEFFELQAGEAQDRTFMGGMRISARVRLFFLTGLFALAAGAGLFVFAENRLFTALDAALEADRVAELAGRLELGIANARGAEKAFLLSKDPAIAEDFQTHMAAVTGALNRLVRIPSAAGQRKHIDTIRDGLAQYDEQFAKLLASEKALGLTDGTGLSRELQNVTEDLQAKFSTAGFANLAGQVSRINQEGKETLLFGFKKGVDEIRKRYQTLIVFLKETKIPGKRKLALQNLLKQHETYMLAMINTRFSQVEETHQFDDLLSYLAPSTGAIVKFAERFRSGAVKELNKARVMSRAAIAGGGAGLLMFLILVGLMVMRSMATPVRELANVAGQMADGDHRVSIPARGNSDATGTIARALDRWQEALSDIEQLRQELEQTREHLEAALSRAEASDMAAADAVRQALLTEEEEEPVQAELASESAPQLAARPEPEPAPDYSADLSGGPISSASRQLASFSQYVTAAADDVERTEALIKGLDDTTRQMEEMGTLVMSIRDQTNLLTFRAGPRDSGPDNLVILSGEDKEPAEGSNFSDMDMAKRFDVIRDTTERAERVTGSVRQALGEVTRMAREIATTASEQAIEATTKLLSQSEYLQNMLDDVISKVKPSSAAQTTGKPAGEPKDASKKTPTKKA